MSNILGIGDYPAVRAALDTALGEAELPDGVISQTIYEAAAVADVVARYPDAETETDQTITTRLKRAAIYFAAARLCPAAVRITAITITRGDVNFSKQTFDPTERAAELRALADAEIAAIVEPDANAPTRPIMFTLASGTRGR